jgi:hypothetical protein
MTAKMQAALIDEEEDLYDPPSASEMQPKADSG